MEQELKIYLIGDKINSKLIKWLRFWRLDYEIIPRLTTSNKRESKLPDSYPISFWNSDIAKSDVPTLSISGNILPSLHLFKCIYENSRLVHMTPIIADVIAGLYEETFCIYSPGSFDCISQTTSDKKYGSSDYEDDIFNKIGILPNIVVAWEMVRKYWYELSVELTKEVLLPLWIHEVQLDAMVTRNGNFNYNNITSQAIFSRPYSREVKQGSIIDAEKHFLTIQNLSTTGYIYKVKERVAKHPLSLPGVVMIESEALEAGVNCEITVVGHYYNLNLNNKPKLDYLLSLEEYAKILHPIVFYGDEDICNLFLKYRQDQGLEPYTTIIKGKSTDWPIWETSKAYESVTLLKPYLIMDIIKKNPYLSSTFAYMDPGIYKHSCIKEECFIGVRLFEKVDVDEDRITLQKMTGAIFTTEGEVNEESVLCGVMVGKVNAWSRFFYKYDAMVSKLQRPDGYFAEQKIITRLLTLYPGLANTKLGGLHRNYYRAFFNL